MAVLSDFYGIHDGEAFVVCGLGRSIASFTSPHLFRTIGVNDIGRALTPDYTFCMDGPSAFPPDRLRHIIATRSRFIFANHPMNIGAGKEVRCPIRKSPIPCFDDPDALYQIGSPPTSPFLAICLAAHMGARAIGLIGVDFTAGHFFAHDGPHPLTRALSAIDQRFYVLGNALLDRGVKVFNLSAESKLRAFPRLTLEMFYSLQRSGVTYSWTRPARRIFLQTTKPLQTSVIDCARLINCTTPVVCRLIAPNSPDLLSSMSAAGAREKI